MKKQALAVMVAAFGFSFSAQAGNNPLIDQALLENIAEKQLLIKMHREELAKNKPEVNTKYRGVEILELGDELGGFASSNNSPYEEVLQEASSSKVESFIDGNEN